MIHFLLKYWRQFEWCYGNLHPDITTDSILGILRVFLARRLDKNAFIKMGPVIPKNKKATSIIYDYDRRKRKWRRLLFPPHTKNWFLKNLSEVKIMRNIEKTRTVLNKVSFLGDMVQGSEGEKIAHSFSNLISSSTFQSVWITATWVLSLLNFLLLWNHLSQNYLAFILYLSWFVTHQQYFYHPSSFLSCF